MVRPACSGRVHGGEPADSQNTGPLRSSGHKEATEDHATVAQMATSVSVSKPSVMVPPAHRNGAGLAACCAPSGSSPRYPDHHRTPLTAGRERQPRGVAAKPTAEQPQRRPRSPLRRDRLPVHRVLDEAIRRRARSSPQGGSAVSCVRASLARSTPVDAHTRSSTRCSLTHGKMTRPSLAVMVSQRRSCT